MRLFFCQHPSKSSQISDFFRIPQPTGRSNRGRFNPENHSLPLVACFPLSTHQGGGFEKLRVSGGFKILKREKINETRESRPLPSLDLYNISGAFIDLLVDSCTLPKPFRE